MAGPYDSKRHGSDRTATSAVAESLRETVRTMRDNINAAANIQRAELLIDGRSVPVGQLSDAEIDALFPA